MREKINFVGSLKNPNFDSRVRNHLKVQIMECPCCGTTSLEVEKATFGIPSLAVLFLQNRVDKTK